MHRNQYMPFECVNNVVIDCAHILALCQLIVLTLIPVSRVSSSYYSLAVIRLKPIKDAPSHQSICYTQLTFSTFQCACLISALPCDNI